MDGEGVGSEEPSLLSYTLRNVSLAELGNVCQVGLREPMYLCTLEIPIDSGIGLSITIDTIRVFINKTLSTETLINQLLIQRVGLSISIDSR